MKNLITVFLVAIGFLMVACGPEALTPIELVKYVELPSNGLRVAENSEGLQYELQYRPIPYVVVMEKKKDRLADTVLQNRKADLAGMQYYKLRMQATGENTDVLNLKAQSQQEYQERVSYYSFDFRQDLSLVDGSDTLACHLFHFERRYGVTPYVDFMLGFKDLDSNRANSNDKILLIRNQVFNHPLVQMTIQKDAINRVPELITE